MSAHARVSRSLLPFPSRAKIPEARNPHGLGVARAHNQNGFSLRGREWLARAVAVVVPGKESLSPHVVGVGRARRGLLCLACERFVFGVQPVHALPIGCLARKESRKPRVCLESFWIRPRFFETPPRKAKKVGRSPCKTLFNPLPQPRVLRECQLSSILPASGRCVSAEGSNPIHRGPRWILPTLRCFLFSAWTTFFFPNQDRFLGRGWGLPNPAPILREGIRRITPTAALSREDPLFLNALSRPRWEFPPLINNHSTSRHLIVYNMNMNMNMRAQGRLSLALNNVVPSAPRVVVVVVSRPSTHSLTAQ